ncbi:MAG: tetratricopeptide repeat protein [Kouleothrix sp.]|nr:tetratricopeptide repeat protein [Kouleothrix sp.]
MAEADSIERELDQLWDYDDPAASEARFASLLATLPAEAAAHAEALTQIARAQGLQRRFDAARQTLDVVQARLAALPPRIVARYLIERGRALNSAGQPEHARPLFLESWRLARACGADFYAIDAAHMLAIVAAADEQQQWNLAALDLAERTADQRAKRWLGSLHNNIGWACHDRGERAAALEHFEKALAAREQQGQPRETRVARWCVGRALRSLGRHEEALTIQRRLHAEHAQRGEVDGYVEEELGELLLLTSSADEAQPHFARAYAALAADAWLAEHEAARLARLRALGGVSE